MASNQRLHLLDDALPALLATLLLHVVERVVHLLAKVGLGPWVFYAPAALSLLGAFRRGTDDVDQTFRGGLVCAQRLVV